MKITRLKKKLSVSLANTQFKKSDFFVFELKQQRTTLFSEKSLKQKLFIKVISKNIKFSENFDILALKFPLVLKIFNRYDLIYNYLLAENQKKTFKVVFVKMSNIVLKGNDFDLISSLDTLNSFNNFVTLLNRVLPVARILNLQK